MSISIYIANWKMNKPFTQAVTFATKYKNELNELGTKKTIALCPCFPAIHPLAQIFSDSSIAIGAQDCSAYEAGSYTGQVSAQSLKQAGCAYCIIGHSEERKLTQTTDKEISLKLQQLIAHKIIPIICIGESELDYKEKKTFSILSKQLEPVVPYLGNQPSILAYEPVWAIGTGTIPNNAYLKQVFAWLQEQKIPNCKLLYGGSVGENNVTTLKQIKAIDGFLIGGASLDFQKLQKIVSLS